MVILLSDAHSARVTGFSFQVSIFLSRSSGSVFAHRSSVALRESEVRENA
jgi:hypothetical protein